MRSTEFGNNAEQRMLGETLRKFLEQENNFERRRARLAGNSTEHRTLWPQFAELGFLGSAFDEKLGGFGGDARTLAVVMSEIGRGLSLEPFHACAVIAGRVLAKSVGGPDRVAELVAGQSKCVLAHDAGYDPLALPRLLAREDDGDLILTGSMKCIRAADCADTLLVTARLSDRPVIIKVDKTTKGLTLRSYRLMDGATAADLAFDFVRVPRTSEVQFSVPVYEVIRDAIEWGIFGLVAETSGIVCALNNATFQYLGTRKQFGQLIGTFQALRHRAADMLTAQEELTAAVELAADVMDEVPGARRSACVSAAKVTSDRVGRLVGHEAIQMHGGMGVSDELIVSHYGRRLTTIRAELGSADVHRLRFYGTSDD